MSWIHVDTPTFQVESDGEDHCSVASEAVCSQSTVIDSDSDDADDDRLRASAAEACACASALPAHENESVAFDISSPASRQALDHVQTSIQLASHIANSKVSEAAMSLASTITSERAQAAQDLARRLRKGEPTLNMRQHTSKDDPNFVSNFFKASRLHFIGMWRERYDDILDSFPPPPKLTAPKIDGQRVVMHIDMDCFFASVAALGREDILKGFPIVVAWGAGDWSEVSAANYQARASGIRAGMRAGEAARLCPNLVIMPYEFHRIVDTAEKMYRSLLQLTPHVQGVSCDEVYADVTHLCGEGHGEASLHAAQLLAKRVLDAIKESTGCKASIGVSTNRLLARLATKEAKPRTNCPACCEGRCVKHPSYFVLEECAVVKHLQSLPVKELPGVGPETEKKLSDIGVETVLQLQEKSERQLQSCLGEKQGRQISRFCRGVDDRPWVPRPPRKSVGSQISWGVRFDKVDQARNFCRQLTVEATNKLQKLKLCGRSLTVKIWKRQGDAPIHTTHVGHGLCDVISRSAQLHIEPSRVDIACLEVDRLLDALGVTPCDIRGIGVHISGLQSTASSKLQNVLGQSVGTLPSSRPSLVESSAKVVLHLDCNCFFLSVHKRHEPNLCDAGPLVLWQYNDVICVSPEAKAAGVHKHMRPTDAQPLVEGIGGRMVHAFSRKWPGPRVWYGPYTQSSRDVLRFLNSFLDAELRGIGGFVLQRASIDEVFIDISGAAAGSLEYGLELARRIVPALRDATGIHASVGIARNCLLAKLASVAAKPPADGFRTVGDEGEGDAASILRATPATKLPGLGSKTNALVALNIQWASDLQRLSCSQLQEAFNVSADISVRLSEICRGIDNSPVGFHPKQSLSASSWLTDATLADLALKRHAGRGGTSVIVGNGWIFEPHADNGVSNLSRARWLLLSLALDLDERVVDEFLESRQLPTKLTVTCAGAGHAKEPGTPGFTNGQTRSRSVDFPIAAFRNVTEKDVRAPMTPGAASLSAKLQVAGATPTPARASSIGKHPVYGTDFIVDPKPIGVAAMGLPDGPEVLDDDRYRKRIAALVNAAASLISTWAAEPNQNIPIAHLCLTARSMVAQAPRLFFPEVQARAFEQNLQPGASHLSENLDSRKRLLGDMAPPSVCSPSVKRMKTVQSTLNQSFDRSKRRIVQESRPAFVVPAFDISDSD